MGWHRTLVWFWGLATCISIQAIAAPEQTASSNNACVTLAYNAAKGVVLSDPPNGKNPYAQVIDECSKNVMCGATRVKIQQAGQTPPASLNCPQTADAATFPLSRCFRAGSADGGFGGTLYSNMSLALAATSFVPIPVYSAAKCAKAQTSLSQ